ncbi:MAG: UDP-N-acetylmuramate--L-alanine ligase [Thermodesulfovibrionales bacterium]
MFERFRVIHFIGIGGVGMSGIAEVLYNLGYEVTGSDIRTSETLERLRVLGVKVHVGHRPENIDGAHVVVVSSAVRPDNPEVLEAARRGVPVIPRAEMLAELGRLKYAVLVAGSHGKTTTTSFISTVMAHAGFDPTVVIGGRLNAFGTNARLGRGQFLVAEADESDGSFLKLTPTIGVVTNIDREHMDFFRTMDALKEAFVSFMNKVPFYGLSVACLDDPNIRGLLPRVHRKVRTYGLSPDAELRAANIVKGFMTVSFDVLLEGDVLGAFSVPVAGEHNVLNALAAIGVGLELQIDFEKIREAMKGFGGIHRRLEFKGEARGVRVYDDYGHHPTEIRATLRAFKESLGMGRLVVVFQPHRYTRTRDLLEEFAASFGDADYLVMTDIYPAGESPIEGVSTEALVERMKRNSVSVVKDRSEVAKFLSKRLGPEDTVLTLGAGDVWKVGKEVLDLLREQG